MVAFHVLWDVNYFFGTSIPLTSGYFELSRIAITSLFLLLVGVSLILSGVQSRPYSGYLQRGLGIFSYGLLISLVTWLLLPTQFVRFGILHLIGVSIVVAPLFAKLGRWNLLVAGIGLVSSSFFTSMLPPSLLSLPLGRPPLLFSSVDYYPLFPWFFVVLLGLGLGTFAYKEKSRRFSFPNFGKHPVILILSLLGRHSLTIYLLHQLVLFGLFSMLAFFL